MNIPARSRRYFEDGADEVAFLNITGFRDCPLGDMPMLEVGLL
jgi:glutamine amidotransferase/cyclase